MLSFGRGKGVTRLANTDRDKDLPGEAAGGLRAGGREWLSLAKTVAQWAVGRPSLYDEPAFLPFLALGETVYREPISCRDHVLAELLAERARLVVRVANPEYEVPRAPVTLEYSLSQLSERRLQ